RYVKLKLSLLEKKVFEHYKNGKTYREIASELGVSIKTVDNAVNRIRKKLALYVTENFNDN
ncbi:RNA polymerase subunit sigma-70, partial [Geobacillus sp. LEMMJ02]|uniref:sigma factor-like helix-turn-helix DNA-binding protein n=1 Tax=Geobacillus sp. LEMMJ02 TaxID=2595057 RepID=UPI0011961EB5